MEQVQAQPLQVHQQVEQPRQVARKQIEMPQRRRRRLERVRLRLQPQ